MAIIRLKRTLAPEASPQADEKTAPKVNISASPGTSGGDAPHGVFDPLAPRPEITEDERKWLIYDEAGRLDRSSPMGVHLRGIDYVIHPQKGRDSLILPSPDIVPVDWIDPEQGTLDEQ